MGLIDPGAVPKNLPQAWVGNVRRGSRILFWTLLLSPLLLLLAEFLMVIGLALSRHEEGPEILLTWREWTPIVTFGLGLLSAWGVHLITRPGGPQASEAMNRRRRLLRLLTVMTLAIFAMQAASASQGYKLETGLYFWLPRLATLGFASLLLLYLADLANIYDQYPLAVVAMTMAAFFSCFLGCDVLDALVAGTDFGEFVLPVVWMGQLALALVAMCGLLLVTGRMHRLLKLSQTTPTQDAA